ncbi:hypothetical protein ACFXJ6_19600 [Streptomyces sp. NPDC059218]|uniref:hypothetical protein n=1 Tax=unclassified Streptomyces TaxID=2593676 RepID=UPI0036B995F5
MVAFRRALLGYQDRADSGEDLMDPRRRGATFHTADRPETGGPNEFHRHYDHRAEDHQADEY